MSLLAGASPGDLWQPAVLTECLAAAALYLLVMAGPARPRGLPPATAGRLACFLAGLAILFLAFGSPLDYLADHVSFAAHMAQHVVETMAAAPLLLLGLPARWPSPWRPGRLVGAALFQAAFLLSHLPAVYDWTLLHPTPHLVEHAVLLLAAAAMWQPLLGPGPVLPDLRTRLVYLFANGYVMMPLAALLLMAGQPWYLSGAAAHGLSPLGDQQWGAIIMMLGMFLAYGVAAVGLLVTAAVPAGGDAD